MRIVGHNEVEMTSDEVRMAERHERLLDIGFSQHAAVTQVCTEAGIECGSLDPLFIAWLQH